jgi:hypothetical protein
MNAMLSDTQRESQGLFAIPAAEFARMGAGKVAARRCPHCDSIIYSRRHKLCGVCAEELPASCRFDAEVAENVSALVREERLRHRAWMTRN